MLKRVMLLSCTTILKSTLLSQITSNVGQKARSILSEEEGSVMDLERVTKSMTAAVNSLKWEYTNTVVSRITPG